jgi:hypothetical protein
MILLNGFAINQNEPYKGDRIVLPYFDVASSNAGTRIQFNAVGSYPGKIMIYASGNYSNYLATITVLYTKVDD